MFYMAMDNDLEAASLNSIAQMAEVGSTPDVNILVLGDRSPKGEEAEEGNYSNEPLLNIANWAGTRLFKVEKGRLRQLADWGDINTAEPGTVTRFLKTVMPQFPAERYGLVFGDHGMAWPGACSTETHDDKHLTLGEITAALQAGLPAPIELVGFDCCLMGTIEVADALAPYAKTLVASEELEPSDGWSLTPTLAALAQNPKLDGEVLGRIICNEYKRQFDASEDAQTRDNGLGVTLSVTRLDRAAGVSAAVAGLAGAGRQALKTGGREAWVKLARARSKAEEYGKDGDPKDPGAAMHDLVDLCTQMRAQFKDGPVAQAAQSTIEATKRAVAHNVRGKARPRATGLAIFFAPTADDLAAEQPERYQEVSFAKKTGWHAFLADYLRIAGEDHGRPDLEHTQAVDETADKPKWKLRSRVKGDDIDEAMFVLGHADGDNAIMLGTVPVHPDENGKLEHEWDGGWFVLRDQENELLCPVTAFDEVDGEEDSYFVLVPAQIKRAKGQQWQDVTLYFLLDFGKEEDDVKGELVYVFRQSKAGLTELPVRKGDQLRPRYLKVDAQGHESLTASNKPDDWLQIDHPDHLSVGYQALPKGDYVAGFLVSDLAGNLTDDLVAVTLK